jgi:hypothetical protein
MRYVKIFLDSLMLCGIGSFIAYVLVLAGTPL